MRTQGHGGGTLVQRPLRTDGGPSSRWPIFAGQISRPSSAAVAARRARQDRAVPHGAISTRSESLLPGARTSSRSVWKSTFYGARAVSSRRRLHAIDTLDGVVRSSRAATEVQDGRITPPARALVDFHTGRGPAYKRAQALQRIPPVAARTAPSRSPPRTLSARSATPGRSCRATRSMGAASRLCGPLLRRARPRGAVPMNCRAPRKRPWADAAVQYRVLGRCAARPLARRTRSWPSDRGDMDGWRNPLRRALAAPGPNWCYFVDAADLGPTRAPSRARVLADARST